MDCGWSLPHWLLAIASVPAVMALGVLTWMLWNMLRGHRTISARDDRVQAVMDALHQVDEAE